MAGADRPEGASDDVVREVTSKSLKCPSCGAPWTLRGFANTKTYACQFCGSVLDTTKPEWQIVDKVERKRQQAAIWPLGQRAQFGGRAFELLGWMERYVEVDGIHYRWEEHLFFNPYHGFRYLIYQDGHFQLVEPLPGFPFVVKVGGANLKTATYEGVSYRHFTTGVAHVADLVGEFPWRVKRGETVNGYDFVAPPSMLSCEESGGESGDVVWSRGTYLSQDEVFAAVGPPKRPVGYPREVYPNQPNPYAAYDWLGKATAVALVAWLLITGFYFGRSEEKEVLRVEVPPKSAPAADPVSAPGHHVYDLVLASRRDPATLEIDASAPVENAWAYCDCHLVDASHERAYPFAVEVSYSEGNDGGHWSEGSRSTAVELGAIPNGKYVLEVERGDDANVPFTIVVKRDVSFARYPFCAFFLILVFPAIALFLRSRFESRRWAQSDHAP
jgi:hypothetical protein